jgi:DNA-binding MarR family transcriptional regulator
MTENLNEQRRGSRGPSGDGASAAAALRAMDGLRRVVRALSSSARGAPGGDGLSGAQLFVLRQIASAPALSLGELAERTLARQSTISEVIGRLVERGLVTRRTSRADARRAELRLTARGRRAIEGTGTTVQEQLAEGLAALPDSRRLAIAEGLELWLAAAGLGGLPAQMFFEEDGASCK